MNKKEKFGKKMGSGIETLAAFAMGWIFYMLFESSSLLFAAIAAIFGVAVLSEFFGDEEEVKKENDSL